MSVVASLIGVVHRFVGWLVFPALPMGPTDPPTINLTGGTSNPKIDQMSQNGFAVIKAPFIFVGVVFFVIGLVAIARNKGGVARTLAGLAIVVFFVVPNQVMNTFVGFVAGIIP